MTAEQFGVRYEYGGKVFRVPSLEAAQHIAGSGAEALSKVGRSWVEVDPGTGPVTHWPRTGRFAKGLTTIHPRRQLYGVTLRCSCGQFDIKSNEAPANGGKRHVEEQFTLHLAEVAASLRP